MHPLLLVSSLASLLFFLHPFVAPVRAHATPTAVPVEKEVALTFDDGPYGTSTQEVIDILQKAHVPATFFLVGQNVARYPGLVKEEAVLGYELGNHTYDHPKNLTSMTLAQVNDELTQTDGAIASSTGIHTKLFRPPYGHITKRERRELAAEGYTIVMWNVDPRDWDYVHTTSDKIVSVVLGHLQTNMVILLHDGRDICRECPRDNVVDALPTVIADLKEQGYTFVTADKLAGALGGP